MAWISVIAVMIEAYRKLAKGAEVRDVLNLYSLMYWIVSYVDDNTLVTTFKEDETDDGIIEQMTNNLECWQRLLQLTGGDIDVDKSQWCILKWRYEKDWGTPSLISKKNSTLEIKMSSPIDPNKREECYQRLDPWEADRVLGVRLPMDGNMREEYKYRLEQAKTFTRKLINAPLSHYDAHVVYESRYRPMVSYPLSVTTFSSKQCNEIQKPFVAALLPKIGLNRNMPRVVIYGPMELGGREIMDLRIEQQVQQWNITKGHLRRGDRAGKGLMATMNDHQCLIGSSVKFLHLDPEVYNYGDRNTRWTYIWKILWEAGLKAQTYDCWLPEGKGRHDKNIMDIAVQDPMLQSKKWPLLEHINCCRLYLKAFTISDLSTDGLSVDMKYLSGTEERQNPLIEMPSINRPTELQWKVWKAFIFRNFLSPGTNINPPIEERGQQRERPKLRTTESQQVSKLYESEGLNLREIINEFPRELQTLIGEVTIPDDDGLSISESMVEGICITASDGGMIQSFQEVQGGYGYVIGNRDKNAATIKGFGACPYSDKISSQTAEHYGLLGLLCMIHSICIRYKLCEDECFGKVLILIDNKNVVKRFEKAQEPYNVSDFSVPDYDLWKLTTDLLNILPIRTKCRWIKAHQDESSNGVKINGPFKPEVQMNIFADELATKGVKTAGRVIIYKPIFSTTTIGIKTRCGKDVEDFRNYLLMKNNGKEMLNYYETKKGWKMNTIRSIDWEALNSLLRHASPIQKNRHIQTLHNWQNVGSQKGKIRDSRLGRDVQPPLQPTEEEKEIHLCPNGCGETEESMHYIRCQEKEMMKKRDLYRERAMNKLKKLRTNEGILGTVNQIIKRISNDDEMFNLHNEVATIGGKNLQVAIKGQEIIGWTAMIQGFVHKDWAEIQNNHYKRTGLNKRIYSKKRWKREFVNIVTQYGKDCWTSRNEAIHGKTTTEGRTMRLERLRNQVKQLYGKRRETTQKQKKNLYSVPLEKRLKFGVQALTLWVGKAEEVLKLNREQAAKYTIPHWLGSR